VWISICVKLPLFIADRTGFQGMVYLPAQRVLLFLHRPLPCATGQAQ
jgi:hypothetical protein